MTETSPNQGTPISIIAALGNPGGQYRYTRHNIAWQMIENLSFFAELRWEQRFKGEFAVYRCGTGSIYFIKPLTFMNLSGQSLAALVQFFKLDVPGLLVIHDDLEMDFGFAGFKRGGGLGGHNGLRSITSALGTRDFNRMRLGISRPPHPDITSYVLGAFSPDERILLPAYLEKAAQLLEQCLEQGFDAMEKPFRKIKLIES